jgi:group I intron endonuclease
MITYIATNTINGKFYIGSTINFERRKDEHIKSKDNYPFQNSLRKNSSLFEWEVYEDTYDKPILEQTLLDMWWGKSQCYNINQFASRPPDSTGRLVKDETRKKISEKMKGRTISENTKLIISQSNKTRQLSRETLKKKSDAVSGERNPFYGKRHNTETLQKFSEQRKGKKWWYNNITNETRMSKECPGEGWGPGRKPKNSKC